MQAIWKKHLGANIKIKQMEWTSYITNMFDKNYDLAAGGWIGDYMDPLTFLDMWMKDAGNNRTGWHSEKIRRSSRSRRANQRSTSQLKAPCGGRGYFLGRDVLFCLSIGTLRNYLLHTDVKGWDPLLLDNHPTNFSNFMQCRCSKITVNVPLHFG